ncbi:MAG: YbjN domain-containing protein [Micavibrio sp.]
MSDLDLFEDISNPLDCVEEVLHGNEWVYDRPTDSEIVVQTSSPRSHYRMTFLWQEEYSAMQFFCEMDEVIPKKRTDMATRLLKKVNEQLWLGHFDIPADTRTPVFRYTCLFRGTQTSGIEHIEDIVEIAMAECERFHNVFALLATAPALTENILELAMADHGGAA